MAESAVDQAKDAVSELAGTVQSQVAARLSDQIGQVSETVGQGAEAMRFVGKQLREQDQAPLADVADQIANQVERASGFLEGKNLDELLDEVQSFARRQPSLFVGGAFVLGVLASRFLRSSGARSNMSGYYTPASRGWQPTGTQGSATFRPTGPSTGALPRTGGYTGGAGGATIPPATRSYPPDTHTSGFTRPSGEPHSSG